jgi:hypothetical protein
MICRPFKSVGFIIFKVKIKLQLLFSVVTNLKGLKETKNFKLLREEYYDIAFVNQANQISAAMQTSASLEDVVNAFFCI